MLVATEDIGQRNMDAGPCIKHRDAGRDSGQRIKHRMGDQGQAWDDQERSL